VLEVAWPIWLLVVGLLVTVFFVIDTLHARRQERPHYRGEDLAPAVSLYGASNLLFIVLILFGVLAQASINEFAVEHLGFEAPWREMLMVVAAVASLRVTPFRIHLHNQFNYAPIREVAFLFIGIFLTMLPALNYLYNRSVGSDERFLRTPGQFYFATGALSSFLDNAPTYLTFFKTELGMVDEQVTWRELAIANRDDHALNGADVQGLTPRQAEVLRESVAAVMKYHAGEVATHRVTEESARIAQVLGDKELRLYLVAISMGAVLFGACTYIGNGPNFMVKSIAEHAGVKMPSFFGYILVYTFPVLLPILVLVWAFFLRG
jgi:Na+/H+ antiporter NhaD/arsenite permease-like protein